NISGFADWVLKLAAEKKAGKRKVKGGPAVVVRPVIPLYLLC
ncbi:hypothetical protein A2U01_0071581, partial [Trifolium medium]|nr:hypothetical protein [Trifolium medium]